MPISIYPPILQSTQPAFLYTVTSYAVYFTLQQITDWNNVGHVQLRVVKQSNNRSIINTALYPDGTIYRNASDIRIEDGRYVFPILTSDLGEVWKPGILYKVQMRFGTTSIFTSTSDFATWKQQQIDMQTFSEWSTVMVIKAISQPELHIKNAEIVTQDVVSSSRVEATTTPLFKGSCDIKVENKEAVDKYKFDIYSGREVDSLYLLESSGWLQHDSVANSVDSHRFKTVLQNDQYYTVIYSIITVNGYEAQAKSYTFQCVRSYYAELQNVSIRIDDADTYCRENGCIRIYLTSADVLNGSFVLTRSDERSNYQVWEDLQFFVYNRREFDDFLMYTDFTIESGIKYKYALQEENASGLRTAPVYEARNPYHYVDFEYSYLFHNGIQLKLQFNNTMNSFRHVVLSSKQDTLGDRYTHILKNGYAYYAEFPVNGLISFKMDYDQTFFTMAQDGFYYDGELVIPMDKLPDFEARRDVQGSPVVIDTQHLTIDTNLTDNNIFVERLFREKAESFLNNYDYKLFRSATEGNIVVVLTNVSMTPNTSLGRMIYEFSATAYEVMESTIENLDKYGIINIGQFETLSSTDININFGQISGLYTTGNSPVNVYSLIKEKEEVSIGGGYKVQLEKIRSFWVDQYPKTKLKAERTELEAEKSKLIQEGLPTTEIDEQIQELQNLLTAIEKPSGVFIINVNGKDIILTPNKPYHLQEQVQSLSIVRSPYPLIFNYICELSQVQDLSSGIVQAVDSSHIWGQISGIFTTTDKILKTYDSNYKDQNDTYRVYNPRPDGTVSYDSLGRVLVDNTTYNAYRTKNLYAIIEEEARHQVELLYNVKEGFYQDELGRWTDGTLYYEFSDIITFDIEADPGTILKIGPNFDGSQANEIMIGPTAHYSLSPMDSLVRYIVLRDDNPQFCIINYKCLTNQLRMLEGE